MGIDIPVELDDFLIALDLFDNGLQGTNLVFSFLQYFGCKLNFRKCILNHVPFSLCISFRIIRLLSSRLARAAQELGCKSYFATLSLLHLKCK